MLEHLVEQHASDAAFLWTRRDKAAVSPHHTLQSLAEIDERVEAHVDGLRIASDLGWELAKASFDVEEPGTVFVVGVLGLERDALASIAYMLDQGCAEGVAAHALGSALGWMAYDQAEYFVEALLDPEVPPILRELGISVSALHRRDPETALGYAITDSDARLRARALRAAGELGRADLADAVRSELTSADPRCRFWAAWTGALFGEPASFGVLDAFGSVGGDVGARARDMLLRALPVDAARGTLERLSARGLPLRDALAGAAAIGDPALVPWILDVMEPLENRRVAAEALSAITGIEITGPLSAARPEAAKQIPSDDPAEDDVAPDPDEPLAWPDVDAVKREWSTRRSGLRDGARYLLGKEREPSWLAEVVRVGRQPCRASAAIELSMSSKRPLFDVTARAVHQSNALRGR